MKTLIFIQNFKVMVYEAFYLYMSHLIVFTACEYFYLF